MTINLKIQIVLVLISFLITVYGAPSKVRELIPEVVFKYFLNFPNINLVLYFIYTLIK